MLRRPNNQQFSEPPQWEDSQQRYYDNWDGIERRGQLNQAPYDRQQIVIEQAQRPAPDASSSNWAKFFSSGPIMGLLIAAVTSGGSFIFDLYNKSRDMEYKQQTFDGKIGYLQKQLEQFQLEIKDNEKQKKSLEDQINSLEDTVMQIYRSKK